MHTIPIHQIKGSRLFWSQGMNIYYLEYNFKGRITQNVKQRSFFYRPENITNRELWEELKKGNEVVTMADIKTSEELDLHRKMRKRAKTMAKYK